jgi:uncharacterized protein YdaT
LALSEQQGLNNMQTEKITYAKAIDNSIAILREIFEEVDGKTVLVATSTTGKYLGAIPFETEDQAVAYAENKDKWERAAETERIRVDTEVKRQAALRAYYESTGSGLPEIVAIGIARNFYSEFNGPEKAVK